MFLFLPTWIWLLCMAGLIGFVGLYAWWHRRPGSLLVTGSYEPPSLALYIGGILLGTSILIALMINLV